MPLRLLRASTRILLNPEFVKAPTLFARQHRVKLAGEVFPATSYKKDPDTKERASKNNANIHIIKYNAIRIFTEREADGDWIKTIDLNPSLLLYNVEGLPLNETDLTVCLGILKEQVTPLLANPLDACHIVPGLARDEQIASWSRVDSEILIEGVALNCLHSVSHPDTGPAMGGTKKRLKLGDNGNCVILIESEGETSIRVRVTLKGHALTTAFCLPGNTSLIANKMCLIKFCASDVAHAHSEVMSWLEGFYMPVPPEWRDSKASKNKKAPKDQKPKALTAAKTLALLSKLTQIPPSELWDIHIAESHASESTCKRLKKDIVKETAHLKTFAIAELFHPEVYATQPIHSSATHLLNTDPLISAVYAARRRRLRPM